MLPEDADLLDGGRSPLPTLESFRKTRCPECDSRASRQFVAVPIVFKGSGFYVNDYGKSSSYTSTKSGTNGASADSGKSDESSSKAKAKSGSSESDE